MSDKNHIAFKAYMLYIIVAILMVVVVFRVVAIQYGSVLKPVVGLNDSTLTTVLAEKLDSVAPLRGRILTEDGSVLVTSIPLYDLHMDLKVVKKDVFNDNVDSLAWNLSQVFPERSKAEWRVKLSKARTIENQYFKLKNKVKYTVYQKVKKFPILRKGKFKGGFIVERYSKQHKPHGLLAKRTLGYVKGGSFVGIEGAYNDYLQGEFGTIIKRKVNGSWKPAGDYIKDPVNGADVITAIDINIQDVAENELLRQLKFQGAKHGSVILMEVETGYIKAIANLTLAGDGEYYEMYNHAVGSKTVPGSTFKLATLMALLEDNKADLNQIVNAKGVYHFYEEKLSDSNNGFGYGKITLKRAFEVSSNVIAQIAYDAYKTNPQKFIDRLKSFGLGDALGVDLVGEPKPTLNNAGDNNWSGISIPWMSIGYEVQQTPLQTLAFYNAVANNGQYIKPLFVKEVRKDGQIIKKFEKVVIKEKICSDKTVKELQDCLKGVVENGTAKALKGSNFKIAGKTGTVILSKGEKGYSEISKYQASFAGYFPAENPKYTCIVVIAGPTQQIYGAKVAGSVFKSIADKVYAGSLQYHKSFNEKPNKKSLPKVKYGDTQAMTKVMSDIGVKYKNNVGDDDWAVAIKTKNGVAIKKRKFEKGKVPSVIGMPLNDAVTILENKGLRVRFEGHGTVVNQDMQAGTKLVIGTQIKLVLK